MILEIHISGTAAPQGSKTPWGSEANPNTRPWRGSVAAAGAQAMPEGVGLLTGPLSMEVAFVFARPKAHFGSGRNASRLKGNAPTYMSSQPDVDKLTRAIADGLQGVVYRNDAQLSVITARKLYGDSAYCHIVVSELPQPTTPPVTKHDRLLRACDGDVEQVRNVETATRGM